MQCLAWEKRLTTETCPKLHSSNPLSPFFLEPIPLYILKYKGLVQTSCTPLVPHITLPTVPRDSELLLKLTYTGVTFLGFYNEDVKKYEPTGKFKRRYAGSSACDVDLNGRLWLDKKECEAAFMKPKDVSKKKKVGVPPDLQMLFNRNQTDRCPLESAISSENSISENNSPDSDQFIENNSKKERKKEYSVNKQKVRQRILGYINTMKGTKELYFWTVSFPAGTPDDICYQAFNTWLTTLRTPRRNKDGKQIDKDGKLVTRWKMSRAMLREYLWIAERQLGERLVIKKDATGTIHFHIAIPHFMNVQRANSMMRGTLKNLAKRGLMPGAVCSAKTGETYFLPCIEKYNGVDICKNKKTGRIVNFAIKKGSRALATYLTKYVTKNDAGVPDETGHIEIPAFTHLAWHNSRGFSCLFTGVTFTIQEFINFGFGQFLNRVRSFRMNFATFIPWLYGPPPLLTDHLYQLNSYIQTLLDDG